MDSDDNFDPTERKELDVLIKTLRDVVRYHSSSVTEASFQLMAKIFTKCSPDSLGNALHLGAFAGTLKLVYNFSIIFLVLRMVSVLCGCACVLCVCVSGCGMLHCC